MVALLMIVLTVIIAFTTNVGKLVTEKIAMQNAVDMAAYAGAATQAGVLNDLRNINQDIWDIHNETRRTFEPSDQHPFGIWFDPNNKVPLCLPPPFHPNKWPPPQRAQLAEQYITLQKGRIAGKIGEFTTKNIQGATKVRNAVEQTADANYSGTRNKVRFYSPNSRIQAVTKNSVQWSYKGWGVTAPPGPCPFGAGIPVGSIMVTETTADSWQFRDRTPGETMVAIGIENAAPATPFVGSGSHGIISQYFRSNDCVSGSAQGGRCPLNVYAAAHPHFGKLGSRHPSMGGQSTWEQQWDITMNNPAPNVVDSSSSLDSHRPHQRNYFDYKVRFIGIFENQAQFLGGTPVSSMNGPAGGTLEH